MIPWRCWLQYAVAGLGLEPAAFWRLTILEWRWLTETASDGALARESLDALVTLYPDILP